MRRPGGGAGTSLMEPMEVEVLHPRPSLNSSSNRSAARHHYLTRNRLLSVLGGGDGGSGSQDESSSSCSLLIDNVFARLTFYLEYYPKLSFTVIVMSIVLFFWTLHAQFGMHHHLQSSKTAAVANEEFILLDNYNNNVDKDDDDLHNLFNNPAGGGASAESRFSSTSSSEQRETLDVEFHHKAAQLDHWCWNGGNDECSCQDFSEAIPARTSYRGSSTSSSSSTSIYWNELHTANVQRVEQQQTQNQQPLDVVFLGDDMAQLWNGIKWNNRPAPDQWSILEYWNQTFGGSGNGRYRGMALGIAGDVSSNLLFRIQHGEVISSAAAASSLPKVYWVSIGTNDLLSDGCSEEAVVLGILRNVQELQLRLMEFFLSSSLSSSSSNPPLIVIQGLLIPYLSMTTATTEEKEKNEHEIASIQSINQQLQDFALAKQQEQGDTTAPVVRLEYFDAASLFLVQQQQPQKDSNTFDYYGYDNAKTSKTATSAASKTETAVAVVVNKDLMQPPYYRVPSMMGLKVLGHAIVRELDRLLLGYQNSAAAAAGSLLLRVKPTNPTTATTNIMDSKYNNNNKRTKSAAATAIAQIKAEQ